MSRSTDLGQSLIYDGKSEISKNGHMECLAQGHLTDVWEDLMVPDLVSHDSQASVLLLQLLLAPGARTMK